jgi:hypothetical protein
MSGISIALVVAASFLLGLRVGLAVGYRAARRRASPQK